MKRRGEIYGMVREGGREGGRGGGHTPLDSNTRSNKVEEGKEREGGSIIEQQQ
jgi:hypothetical protein